VPGRHDVMVCRSPPVPRRHNVTWVRLFRGEGSGAGAGGARGVRAVSPAARPFPAGEPHPCHIVPVPRGRHGDCRGQMMLPQGQAPGSGHTPGPGSTCPGPWGHAARQCVSVICGRIHIATGNCATRAASSSATATSLPRDTASCARGRSRCVERIAGPGATMFRQLRNPVSVPSAPPASRLGAAPAGRHCPSRSGASARQIVRFRVGSRALARSPADLPCLARLAPGKVWR